MDIEELKLKANEIRKNIITEVYYAKSGHPGGSLSVADIMTVLYFNELRIDEKNPRWEDRDRLILSKGHCSPALYAALAERGYFEKEKLKSFRNIESNLQGHPDLNKVPGVDMTSGSLGQGLSVANGIAIAGKMDKKDYRVYCIVGDGEIEEVMSSYPIDKKFESFGFNVISIDGNNIEEILKAFEIAKNTKGKPTCIVAKTIKGKGVSFMENKAEWHGKAPSDEQYEEAINNLIIYSSKSGEGVC